VQILSKCHPKLLESRDFLIWMIRATGCCSHDGWSEYHTPGGMLQLATQFADALLLLAKHPIKSIVEIGTYNGKTTSFMVAYLLRFNPTLKATTVDVHDHQANFCGLPIEQRLGTSSLVVGKYHDLCFIDADHSYKAVLADYVNVGKYCKICMFHDINDDDNGDPDPGKLWRELRALGQHEFHEFTDGAGGYRKMGIGIMIKRSVKLL
jgi:hypothetical protein